MVYTYALALNHSLECEKWWLMRNNSEIVINITQSIDPETVFTMPFFFSRSIKQLKQNFTILCNIIQSEIVKNR